MRHRAGLSQLNGATEAELMDHLLMEERMAAAPMGWMRGRPAYHALTYGWLMSGLARAVTGLGMRELIRTELAEPLNTDGFHLGRPPVGAPTQPAQIIGPQSRLQNPIFNLIAPRLAGWPFSGGFGSMYFPGMKSTVQGDTPLLDTELPAANGVATARALARMYGAIANGGTIDGSQFLSAELVAGLTGPAQPAPRRQHLHADVVQPRLPLPAAARRHARVRARRPRRLAWVGRPGLRPGVRVRAQPPADPVGGRRSGWVRSDRSLDPKGRHTGPQAGLRAGHRVRLAVRRAGHSDRLGRCDVCHSANILHRADVQSNDCGRAVRVASGRGLIDVGQHSLSA